MKIQAGKKYVTRSGKVVGPLEYIGEITFCFVGDFYGNTSGWTADGSYGSNCEHEFDLVKEYEEYLEDKARKATKRKYTRPNKESGAYLKGWLDGYKAAEKSK